MTGFHCVLREVTVGKDANFKLHALRQFKNEELIYTKLAGVSRQCLKKGPWTPEQVKITLSIKSVDIYCAVSSCPAAARKCPE